MEPSAIATALSTNIVATGYAVVEMPYEAFSQVGTILGPIVNVMDVAIKPDSPKFVYSHQAVPLHNDHPQAGVVAWYCHEQDAQDGTQILVDGWRVLDEVEAAMPGATRILEGVTAQIMGFCITRPLVMPLAGATSLFVMPHTWRSTAAYHADSTARMAMETYLQTMEAHRRDPARHMAIRLRPGQSLWVDNRRMLHGRDAIDPASSRQLQRIYVDAWDTWHVVRAHHGKSYPERRCSTPSVSVP
jgi:gamma-butyrobetaine dioxygenase